MQESQFEDKIDLDLTEDCFDSIFLEQLEKEQTKGTQSMKKINFALRGKRKMGDWYNGRIDEEKRLKLLDFFKNYPMATIAEISKTVDLSQTKISKLRAEFRLSGQVRTTNNFAKSIERFQNQSAQNQYIQQIVKENSKIGLTGIANKLSFQRGIFLTKGCIHRRLTHDMGYGFISTVAAPSPIPTLNTSQVLLRRRLFATQLQKFQLKNIYVCGIDIFSRHRKSQFAWLPKEELKRIRQKISQHQTELASVGVIITLNHLGVLHYDTFYGYIQTSVLINHLNNGYLSRVKKDQNQIVLIAPEIGKIIYKNAIYQQEEINQTTNIKIKYNQEKNNMEINREKKWELYDKRVTDITENLKIKSLILPHNSPKISPCFYYFQAVQQKFQAYKTLKPRMRSKEHIRIGLKEVMKLVPSSQTSKCFQRLKYYLKYNYTAQQSYFIQKIDHSQMI